MVIKVGINGFGRIGRIISRACLQNPDLELSAINDPAISVEYISYLMKFDSTHGKLKGNITHTNDVITVDELIRVFIALTVSNFCPDERFTFTKELPRKKCSLNEPIFRRIQIYETKADHRIKVFHEKLPQSVPWRTAGIQYVVEASGMFTSLEKASGHLASDGVKRVIVTAPSIDAPMIILGVNENKLRVEQKVLSCASSTLYCLAPIVKVLEDQFGVAEGFVTSIHAMTPSLKPLDGLCLRGKHWRDHRSIHQNIIPASTGACKALGKIIPQMKDKLSGLAFRVPIVNVSVLDLTVRLNSSTTLAEIVKSVEKASRTNMQNIIKISSEQSVSSDFIGESHSCIFDEDSSIQLKPDFFKIICWYENEKSYACRVTDSIIFSEKQFLQIPVIPAKMAYFRPRSSRKQDEIQQTESYMKEISVSCDNASEVGSRISSFSQEKGNSVVVKSRPFIKKPPIEANASLVNYKKKNEIFKIWNDNSVGIKPNVNYNRNAFFQSCLGIKSPILKPTENNAQSRLENVKRQFSKMVNMTEDLLKKTQSNQSDFHALSKSEFVNKSDGQFRAKDKYFIADTKRYQIEKNDPVENCGDCKSLIQDSINTDQVLNGHSNEEEVSCYSYEKEDTDNTTSDYSKGKLNGIQDTPSVRVPKDPADNKKVDKNNSEIAIEDNLSTELSFHNEGFKEQLAKTINTLIDGLTQNIQAKCLGDKATISNNDKTSAKETYHICNDFEKNENYFNNSCVINKHVHDVPKSKSNNYDSSIHLEEKVNLFEKYKTNNVKTNVKLIDEELRKRNIVLVDSSLVAETLPDDAITSNLQVENIEPKRNTVFEQDILEDKTNPKAVVVLSDHNSTCYSRGDTNTTVSNRVKNKQDIYDKLDSASGTDSDNSFEIKERKSQVIHITDLTNSFEDLARLDKICRIIEISDELSDKLFSALDNKNEMDLKMKRWSFRDLCERIHLDEFCNKVFGK